MTTFSYPGKPINDALGANVNNPPSLAERLQAGTWNEQTGQGTHLDKGAGTMFVYEEMDYVVLEDCYRKSWACRKFIDTPIKDMWALGRTWAETDADTVKKLKKEIHRLRVNEKLQLAMKAGRAYGSALAIMVPKNPKLMEKPLDLKQLDKNFMGHIWVVDKNQVEIESFQTTLGQDNFAEPYEYRVYQRIVPDMGSGTKYHENPKKPTDKETGEEATALSWLVHHSWVLRFDGIGKPTDEGWWSRDPGYQWGLSVLHPVIDHILRGENIHASIGHLVEEASTAWMKVAGFNQALQGQEVKGIPTIEERAASHTAMRSIFRTTFMDIVDDMGRLDYSFTGLPEILDRHNQTMAAMADYPATRWMGQSPVGMNSTGESDLYNYALANEDERVTQLHWNLVYCDQMIAHNLGMDEPPDYIWHPLTSLREDVKAEILKIETEAVALAIERNFIDEDEARKRLSQNEWWGELGPWKDEMAPGFESEQGELELKAQQAKAATMKPAGPSANGKKPSSTSATGSRSRA